MRFYLTRIRINQSGYDSMGSYWGIGAPLFHYQDDDSISDYLRADNREHAKDIIRARYPMAKFYR